MMARLECDRQSPNFIGHPKLDRCQATVLSHFTAWLETHGNDETRVMIFSEYRASVEEIVLVLNRHAPMLRAMAFVGQQASKSGSRGITQKEQLEVHTIAHIRSIGMMIVYVCVWFRSLRNFGRVIIIYWWQRLSGRRGWISVKST
jgi:ERCC4-related helicase